MSLIWSSSQIWCRPSWAPTESSHPLTCSLEVEPDLTEAPHHVLELQQEREQTVVLVHAAVGDDDVQRPVHLGNVGEKCRKDVCERKHWHVKQSWRGKKKQVWERKERGASAEMLIKEVTGLGWEDKWGEIKKRKESRIWRGKVIRGLARWTKKTALFAVNVIQTDPTFNQCVSFNHTQVCWFSTCCCV